MDFHGYSVESKFISGSAIKWVTTGNGEFILGKKGGTTYFIKRNINTRYPNKKVHSPAVFAKYLKTAQELENKQQRLRSLMSGLRWDKDLIVAENENFWDDSKFTTITVCVPGIMSNEQVENDLPKIAFPKLLALAKRSAEVMALLHSKGVIHGDLKEKNFVVAPKGGEYYPYLIDFDSAYPADEVPPFDEIGGTPGYQSPEILEYYDSEDDSLSTIITPATDIFTLALVWHKWWTGAFPNTDKPVEDVASAITDGIKVKLDAKFDVKIGDTCGATVVSLINWMLAKDHTKRPTGEQVVKVLSDQLEVPTEFHCGGDTQPFDSELWDAHKSAGMLCSVDELKKKYKSFKRFNQGSGSTGLKYKSVSLSGAERIMSIDELIGEGIVESKEASLDGPWDDHGIEYISAKDVIAKGYVAIKRVELAYKKRYIVTTLGGRRFDCGKDFLITNGLATEKVLEIPSETPWPEHGTAYNPEAMALLNIIKIERMEIGGEKKYKLIRADRVTEGVPVNNMKLMRLITK